MKNAIFGGDISTKPQKLALFTLRSKESCLVKAREVDELFTTHGRALVLYARGWCSHPEDAVQEAFFDFTQVTTRPECCVSWLYTATRRKAQNIARAETRRKRRQLNAAAERTSWFTVAESEGNAESMDANLNAYDVEDCLRQIDKDERELVVAKIWGGLSFVQLGEITNVSASTAFRRYSNALSKLKKLLENNASVRPEKTLGIVRGESA